MDFGQPKYSTINPDTELNIDIIMSINNLNYSTSPFRVSGVTLE